MALVPCGDKEDCNEFKQTQTSHTDHKDDHSDEACTPFCVCACCASNCIVKYFQPVLNQVALVNSVYPVHKESKTSAAIISIWQPPKLS